MFIFMEGMPRAGKSYETVAHYIVPQLKKGRMVDAYIEGLDFERFAEATDLPLPVIQLLLRQLTRDQVPDIYNHVRKNSLIVIDELQNFFPSDRNPLNPPTTKFITEHGHDGHDIIGMGQNLTDCHKFWRNRCNRKIIFQKQDAVGRDAHYIWTSYTGVLRGERLTFKKIRSGSRKYEEKFFGLYKSHTDGTTNFDTFKDDRTNVLKSPGVMLGVPAFFVVFVFCIWFMYGMYSDMSTVDDSESILTSEPDVSQGIVQSSGTPDESDFKALESQFNQAVDPVPAENPVVESNPNNSPNIDYIETIADKYRLRLAGLVKSKTKVIVQIDAFDNLMYLKESFTSEELIALGWDIEVQPFGVRISKGEQAYIARAWPIDIKGRVNSTTARAL